jgi:sugar lactone lactonase YvrE
MKLCRVTKLAVVSSALFFFAVPHADAEPLPRLYWADQWSGQILSANLDGTDVQSIVQRPIVHEPTVLGPHRLAMDEARGILYWTDTAESAVFRTKLGTGLVEPLVQLPAGSYPREIELDLAASKVYWSAGNAGNTENGGIFRANLDGTNIEPLLVDASVAGIDLDVVSGHVFFTQFSCESGGSCVKRIDLDGSSLETLIPSAVGDIDAIEVDVAGGKLYYNDEDNGMFYKANLDGTNVERFINFEFESTGHGLALDAANGKIYWSTRGWSSFGGTTPSAPTGSLGRSNLDGSDVEIFYNGGSNSGLIIAAPVPEPSTVVLFALGSSLLIYAARRRRRREFVSE